MFLFYGAEEKTLPAGGQVATKTRPEQNAEVAK